jgi:hypothetical protein
VVAASPDSRRQPVLVVLLSWGALPLMLVATLAEAAEPSSCKPVARVVSIQGALQIQRAGETDWTYLRRLDATVCEGDLLHTGASGRAALLLSPETLFRVQQNSTVAIRQSAAETVVEYTISEVRDPVRVAPNPCGAGYFITRFPRKFRVLTPFANASVEGTEFLVALSCQSTTVAVRLRMITISVTPTDCGGSCGGCVCGTHATTACTVMNVGGNPICVHRTHTNCRRR